MSTSWATTQRLIYLFITVNIHTKWDMKKNGRSVRAHTCFVFVCPHYPSEGGITSLWHITHLHNYSNPSHNVLTPVSPKLPGVKNIPLISLIFENLALLNLRRYINTILFFYAWQGIHTTIMRENTLLFVLVKRGIIRISHR